MVWFGSIVVFYFHTAQLAEVAFTEDHGIIIAFFFYDTKYTQISHNNLLETCVCDMIPWKSEIASVQTHAHAMGKSL